MHDGTKVDEGFLTGMNESGEVAQGFLLAVNAPSSINPLDLKAAIEFAISSLSDQIGRIDLEWIGEIDLYSDDGEEEVVNGN